MKKKGLFLLLLSLVALFLVGCGKDDDNSVETPSVGVLEEFRLSSVSDVTGEDCKRSYRVYAPYTDSYSIKTKTGDVSQISLLKDGEVISAGDSEINVDLNANDVYELVVETSEANGAFHVETKALNNLVTMPYDVLGVKDPNTLNIEVGVDANIDYTKRSGGTYIYSNNPELVPNDSVNTGFIQDKDLTGDVFFTFEHANYSNTAFYLGYQLLNEGNEDVYITVTNIGYQESGSWFGQLAWYDYYNTQFKLPSDYFNETGAISSKYSGYDYGYQNYKPRVFQPITYRLPAGEYMYVIGGTSKDAYQNINVDRTANLKVSQGKCANGNVKFNVSGGSVTATFYCYSNANKVQEGLPVVGYRTSGNYGVQYGGSASHHGVIDSYIEWAFDDNTKSGVLPVAYNISYPTKTLGRDPYDEYVMKDVSYTDRNTWMSHLNPGLDKYAIGSDIVEFSCVDEKGNSVVIDNRHADGNGTVPNTANWMIEYQENYTLINKGNRTRKVTLHKKDSGTLAMLIRDSKTGEVIDTCYTVGLAAGAFSFEYVVPVPANSTVQITLCYVLVACSYGNVTHGAKLA